MLASDNPFATDRVERLLSFRPGWAALTWEDLDKQWQLAGYRCSITGRHGAGKTTLISAWKQRLTANGDDFLEFFLNKESQGLSPDEWGALEHQKSAPQIIILDGEEQLSYLHRRKFYNLTQNAKGIIVTRHRQNHLHTLVHLDPSIEILHRCIRELAPNYYETLEPRLESWWKTKNGNIREILLECYDAV